MPKTPSNPENVSPYKLLDNFSRNRVVACIFLALVIHVTVIGGLSTDYIYRTWINPGANPDEQMAGSPAEDEPGNAKPSGETPDETPPAGATGSGHPAKDPPAPSDPRENAPVVDRVIGKADPDAIPKQPAGVGISIDDLDD
ncbi:MAG: hypothetical protein HQ567_04105 [Candidatus Nealsonbacteria bacterium]|nr:hypothetical protein [Candidatus Nealsonbacteria bacterium]